MSFEEKYEMYKDISFGEIDKLKTRLNNNIEESLKSLYSNIGVTNEVKYLINELLEDKEHLDAFVASKL